MKNEQGITLIALVITIIVLLILAGVSISVLVGNNGILNQTTTSVEETKKARVKEEIELAWSSVDAEYWDAWMKDSTLIKEGYFTSEKLNKYLGDKGIVKSISLEQIDGVAKYYIVTYEDSSDKQEYTVKIDLVGKVTETEKVEPSGGSLPEGVEKISKTDHFVGCEADVDGDGEPDGIIYADLAIGTTGSGEWSEAGETYEIPIVDNLKDYYITEYTDEDGTTKQVITSMGGSANDRFYVMALNPFESESGNKHFFWYIDSVYEGGKTKTGFGEGRTNTQNMIESWNSLNEEQKGDVVVIWDAIQDEVDKGWFVPSKDELIAHCGETGIGLSTGDVNDWFMTSSEEPAEEGEDTIKIWCAAYWWECMTTIGVTSNRVVQLSTTF